MAKKQAQNKKQEIKKVIKPIEIAEPKFLPIWGVLIFFALTTIIFFWEQLFGNSYFWEDFVEYVYPTQSFAASSSGIPFWNPFSFNGMPFFADLQVGFFYPINRILGLFVDTGGVLSVGAAQFVIIIHFFFAQISMYLLGRYWKISSYGSIIAAVSFAFSMIMVCHVIHPMMIYHLAWFPLIIMYFIKGMSGRNLKFSIIAGLIFGFTMLSGHPQTTLYEAFFLGIVFLWYLIADIKAKKTNIPMIVIAGIIPIIIAAGTFAVQLMPSQELAGLSMRDEMTFDKSTEGSLQFKQIYTSVVPKVFGYMDGSQKPEAPFYLKFKEGSPTHFYWETSYYFGITALILGLVGAINYYRKREGAMLLAIAAFGFLFALGDNGFLYKIFFNLPLFGSFRNPARLMFYVVIAFSLLSGFGFDYLWKSVNDKKAYIKIIIASIIPLFIALLIASGSIPNAIETPQQLLDIVSSYGTTALLLALAITVLSYLIIKSILKAQIGGVLLIVAAVIDLTMSGASFNQSPVNPMGKYKLDPKMDGNIEKFIPKPPKDLYRVSMRLYKPPYMAMARNQGLLDRIQLVEGYNPLVLANLNPPAYKKFNEQKAYEQYYDLYNVRYHVYYDGKSYPRFVERKNSLPRAWMVHKANVFAPESIENAMKDKIYDFRNEVVLVEDPGIALNGVPVSDDVVECLDYENNYIKYKTESTGNGILCLSEVFYPAWQAYIDGKPVKILKSNYAFRAIPVPSGKHTIEMKYESSSFASGMWISLGTIIFSVVGLVILSRKETTENK